MKPFQTVQKYLTSGYYSVRNAYGSDHYDETIKTVLIPGLTDLMTADSGEDSELDRDAAKVRSLLTAYPEEMGRIITTCIMLGIGFSAQEEIR